MKTFTEFEDPYADLNEIGQSGSLRFCFATKTEKDTYVGQHVFVKCRDFLNDVVIACDEGYSPPGIYGFHYDGEENPIDTDKTRLVIRLTSEEEYEAFRSNLKKLNNMLHSSGVQRTRAWSVLKDGEEREGVHYLVLDGDPRWQRHVTSMSFYSLMIRAATTRLIPALTTFAQYLLEEGFHTPNDWEYLSEFNRAFNHPKNFITNMELLSMENVHMSIRECGELEHAHERGGIKVFSELVWRLREGRISSYLENECYSSYDEDPHPDLESTQITFPTIQDAKAFV